MEVKELKDAKKEYDNIEIPSELSDVVNKALEGKNVKMNNDNRKSKKIVLICKWVAGIAAAFVIFVGIGVNASETLAMSLKEMPVIGYIADIFTVRGYEEHKPGQNISVAVPELSVGETENDKVQNLVVDVNEQIQVIVDEYVANAKANYEDYKDAYISTGGKEVDLENRDMDINVSYDIMYKDDTKVSFVLTGYESWVNYSQMQVFYNLDLINGTNITLKDMLGENWIEICNEEIVKQIEERVKTEDAIFWGFEEDKELSMPFEGFKSVDENTTFFINAEGNPVVVFEKYSIAPGYMGTVTFEIK